tara:strand:+ start:1169 stop:2008 length:840 start_codon:yes stop_codon:yes gene_type:complete
LIKSKMTFENAFCFGNGKSRLAFDMDIIKDKGMTFGCNGIYRDMEVDHLICLDNQITHEIYRSGYCSHNNTWIRDWTPLPIFMLHDMLQQFPYADVLVKKDDTEFVVHGSDEVAVNQKFERIMKEHPEISRERLEVDRQQVKTYITGCKDAEDNAFNLPEDKEYAAGPTSIYIALHLGAKNVFIIGHDLYSNDGKLNNIYGGTEGYLDNDQDYVKPDTWILQHKENFDAYPQVNFYKVNLNPLGTTPTDCFIDEWKDCQNLHYITQEEVIKHLDNGWMM